MNGALALIDPAPPGRPRTWVEGRPDGYQVEELEDCGVRIVADECVPLTRDAGDEDGTPPWSSAGLCGSAERAQYIFQRGGEQFLCRLAGGLAAQPPPGSGAVQAVQAFQRVALPGRVLGDVGVEGREQRDGAASEVADNAPHLGGRRCPHPARWCRDRPGGSPRSSRANVTPSSPLVRVRSAFSGPRSTSTPGQCRSVAPLSGSR